MAVKKKVSRPRTGLNGAPIDQGFQKCKYYFHYDIDKKAISDLLKSYIKSNFSKDNASTILLNPEYTFTMFTHFGATVYWINSGCELEGNDAQYKTALDEYLQKLLEKGKAIKAEQDQEEKKDDQKKPLTPQQRFAIKIGDTIMADIDEFESQLMDGQKASIDLYERFKVHQLTSQAISHVQPRIEETLAEYNDALNKTCEQAVEAYSHLTKTEIKRRVSVYTQMLDDLEKVRNATKAKRAPRAKKPKSIDKQIEKVKYQKENSEYKLVSINPTQIVGSRYLYTFNTKTRKIVEYFTDSTSGFEISGTSIKNFDPEKSRTTTLRKPEEFIPIVVSKTVKQIDKEFGKLTTKMTVPNGRLNEDTILLRVV